MISVHFRNHLSSLHYYRECQFNVLSYVYKDSGEIHRISVA